MQVAADHVTQAAEAMGTFALVQDHPFRTNDDYPALCVTHRDPRFEKLDRKGLRYAARMGLRVAILVRQKNYDHRQLEDFWTRYLEELARQGHAFDLLRAPQYEATIAGNALRIAVLHLDFEANFQLDP